MCFEANRYTLGLSDAGGETDHFYKHLASKISNKAGQRYCDTVAFVRRRLRFDLLKTCVISLRGYRGKQHVKPTDIELLDLNQN